MEEVRMQYLRPAEWTARRDRFPAAFIPIGTLEWHGPQNPMGADTIQAEGLCEELARQSGGVAFPPLYYGENRSEAHMESNPGIGAEICRAMGLPEDSTAEAYQPFGAMEQTLDYQKLLLRVLAEAENYGFRLAVLVAGHYPLIDHATAAATLFNKRRVRSMEQRLLAFACTDYRWVRERYPFAGDHGAGWETSHLLWLCPDRVDLSLVPPAPADPLGCSGRLHAAEATAELGHQSIVDAAAGLLPELYARMEHRERYFSHGNGFLTRDEF